ncbi:MAG: cell division protein FtsZ [Pseudomonadota bacterium]|jgi:cell division protein FtsZ|nr:MAG: cell division protein FtsZ [Pseudomonadota bacterium]
MSIRLQLPKVTDLKPRIAVIGVGGAGGNAVNNMIAAGLTGVTFIVANTDAQALSASSAEHRIQLGVNLTEGLGAGSKPEIGEAAAEEAVDEIRAQISGSHMVFIAAGMGGGTGTGAASVIARVAKELEILTVAVVTKPFHFEGSRRMRIAEAGIAELRKYVDTLIVIPNQNLFRIANEKTTFAEAFVLADQVLYSGIACIVDLIVKEGLINLDFADVRTIMSGMGTAMMGTGEASGPNRAIQAAEEAISNPLLDDISLRGAKGLLVSIIGGRDLTLYEVDEAASRVRQEVDPDANIIVGATFDESLGDRVRVSIVASGMEPAQPSTSSEPASYKTPSRPQSTVPPPAPEAATSNDRGRPNADFEHPASEHFTDVLSRVIKEDAPQEPATRKPREVWRGPGDVVIEEGPPQLGTSTVPPPLPPQSAAGAASRPAEPFTPGPPVEVARRPPQMPRLEDFPIVAQQEYWAKTGRQNPSTAQPQHGYAPPPEQKKPSLFRRITGWRTEQRAQRNHEDSQNDRSVTDHGQSRYAASSRQGMSSEHSRDECSGPQHVDIPMFFDRGRNRR